MGLALLPASLAAATWSATGPLATARFSHTATRLADGRVLVAGGDGAAGYLASAELFNPATGTWSATGSLNTARSNTRPRGWPTAGSWWWGDRASLVASAELYDPATGTWSNTGSLSYGRVLHTATRLDDGRVLVAGGTCGFFHGQHRAL